MRIDADKAEADIEDTFTDDDYLKAVNAFYSRKFRDVRGFCGITKRDIGLDSKEAESPRIVKRLEKLFLSHSNDGWGSFDKRGVCDFFCDELMSGRSKLSTKSKERFDALFAQIRAAVEGAGTATKATRVKSADRA